MPIFSYTARDPDNKLTSGSLDGASIDEIADILSGRGCLPLDIAQLNFDGSRKGLDFFAKVNEKLVILQSRVPHKSIVFFTRQLATMIGAGVPLATALEQLAGAEQPTFRRIITQVSADISRGSAFSDAIAHHRGAFSDVYVALTHAGEAVGALDRVMDDLANYLESSQEIRSKVSRAMMYPVFIGGFVTVMIFAILIFLVPIFENLYGQFNAKLPPLTAMFITLSQVVRGYFGVVVGIMAAVLGGFVFCMTIPAFKYFVHRMLLAVPVFGGIMRKNVLARFCRTMSLLMGSGTPILQAVEIVGTVVGNKVYADKLESVYGKLRAGELLSVALAGTGEFPPLVRQMAATGETAGRIDELFKKAAEFYEREMRATADGLASIIEPFLIIVLGSVVAAILIALYLPVFTLGRLMH